MSESDVFTPNPMFLCVGFRHFHTFSTQIFPVVKASLCKGYFHHVWKLVLKNVKISDFYVEIWRFCVGFQHFHTFSKKFYAESFPKNSLYLFVHQIMTFLEIKGNLSPEKNVLKTCENIGVWWVKNVGFWCKNVRFWHFHTFSLQILKCSESIPT